jgi:AraC-like DNA-binding protein/ligand-binding sensor protein
MQFAPKPPNSISVAAALFEWAEAESPLKINFHDYYNLSDQIPLLKLAILHRSHSCKFCEFAKGSPGTLPDCLANKLAVNRLALRRSCGFYGLCHLGVMDIVEPLKVDKVTLGVLFYGSVTVQEKMPQSIERIRRYCHRRGLDPKPFLKQLRSLPMIQQSELIPNQQRLKRLASIIQNLVRVAGIPLERYKEVRQIGRMGVPRRLPFLVARAAEFIEKHYNEDLDRQTVATALNCHPNHLSRLFNQSMGCGLIEYQNRMRINQARLLLSTRDITACEVCFEVGFGDQSHFGRIFKRITGTTPGEYARHRANQV